MGQLLVRKVSDEAIAALRARAEANGRSVEAEHRAVLQGLAKPADLSAWLAEADRLREATKGRGGPTSEQIIREDRDSH